MKKRVLSILFIILAIMMIMMPQVKANGESNNTVIANITDESAIVEKNKNVFVEMSIENIENVKSIIGYIASTTDSEQYITVELQSTNQGTWYYFILPSTTVVGQTYIMPMIEVTYEDGTKVTGKATGEFKVIEETYDYSKVIGNITDESKTVEQNKTVFVEMSIENIENVKSIIGYIASTTNPEQYTRVELQNTTQGTWYYFIMPSTAVVGQTYTIPKVEVTYEDGTKVTGRIAGEVKIVKNSEEPNSSNNGDSTIAKDKLPNAGKDMLIGTITILAVFVTIIAIKNKKYKGIK